MRLGPALPVRIVCGRDPGGVGIEVAGIRRLRMLLAKGVRRDLGDRFVARGHAAHARLDDGWSPANRLAPERGPIAASDALIRRIGELIDVLVAQVAAPADDLFERELVAELALQEEQVLALLRVEPFPTDAESDELEIALGEHGRLPQFLGLIDDRCKSARLEHRCMLPKLPDPAQPQSLTR
jgi:hypothetical protein